MVCVVKSALHSWPEQVNDNTSVNGGLKQQRVERSLRDFDVARLENH